MKSNTLQYAITVQTSLSNVIIITMFYLHIHKVFTITARPVTNDNLWGIYIVEWASRTVTVVTNYMLRRKEKKLCLAMRRRTEKNNIKEWGCKGKMWSISWTYGRESGTAIWNGHIQIQ